MENASIFRSAIDSLWLRLGIVFVFGSLFFGLARSCVKAYGDELERREHWRCAIIMAQSLSGPENAMERWELAKQRCHPL